VASLCLAGRTQVGTASMRRPKNHRAHSDGSGFYSSGRSEPGGVRPGRPRRCIPFLEKGGAYWGNRLMMQPQFESSNGCEKLEPVLSFSFRRRSGG